MVREGLQRTLALDPRFQRLKQPELVPALA